MIFPRNVQNRLDPDKPLFQEIMDEEQQAQAQLEQGPKRQPLKGARARKTTSKTH